MKKYDKTILAEHFTSYNDRYFTVLVLDDNDYYNIHVIDDKFKDDELNTLKLQEPKSCVTLEEVTDPMQLEFHALEHALWDKFYGYKDNMYSFSVSVADTCEL